MKIAISTDQGYVSAHFGRCPSYTLVEVQDGKILSLEEIPNPGHSPGFLPNYLAQKGVNAIIAGGMGPRAQGLFAEKNIQTIIGVQGPVEEVIKKFIRQELESGQDLCDHGQRHEGPCRHEDEPGEVEMHKLSGRKICVTAKGKDLEAEVDPNFGRAHYFLIVNPESLEFEAFENPYAEAAQGAGIQSAQLVISLGAAAILTGEVGPNAQRVLNSADVKIISSAEGTVREAVSRLKNE